LQVALFGATAKGLFELENAAAYDCGKRLKVVAKANVPRL